MYKATIHKFLGCSTLLLLCVMHCFCQTEVKTKSVKLYTNGSTYSMLHSFQSDSISFTSIRNKNFSYNGFTPAFTLNKPNGNFLEMELSQFSFTNSDSKTSVTNTSNKNTFTTAGNKSTVFMVGMRLEQGVRLLKNKDDLKWKPYIGLGVHPNFSSIQVYPKVSSSFASSTSIFVIDVSVIPRITYDLNDKLFLDFNIPFSLSSLTTTVSKVENPSFTPQQQKNTSFNIETLANRFAFRLGVGLKL